MVSVVPTYKTVGFSDIQNWKKIASYSLELVDQLKTKIVDLVVDVMNIYLIELHLFWI